MEGTNLVGGNKVYEETGVSIKNQVFGIELHSGVNFGGFVAGTINKRNAHGLVLTEEANGIRVKGLKCNKLLPWAAMKGIDYLNDDGSEPLASKSRV
jgi:hypothetical protein